MLEAVTKDQLNTGLTGQIRYRCPRRNLYAYLFGVKQPVRPRHGLLRLGAARTHRQLRGAAAAVAGTPRTRTADAAWWRGSRSTTCARTCATSTSTWTAECQLLGRRYGMTLDASLITGIDPPPEVESALAAINTAHNQVSSDISLAQAAADQKIVQSQARRGDRDAEGAGRGRAAASQLADPVAALKKSSGQGAPAYLRNVRLGLYAKCRQQVIMEVQRLMNSLSSTAVTHFRRSASSSCPFWSACCAPAAVRTRRRGAPVPRLRPVRQGAWASSRSPGLHFLPAKLGLEGVPRRTALGKLLRRWTCGSTRTYLRSQPVNSEEGAPMGIGIWYEMFISDPVAYPVQERRPARLAGRQREQCHRALPQQHAAGGDAREPPRHEPDRARRRSPTKSQEWGYKLGSVYIRKVHFRDAGMIRQIEEKVVNRLRQVTSAIKQDGANQVSIITSTAERQAAVEFAKAAAMRPADRRRGAQRSARIRRSRPRSSRCSRIRNCSSPGPA